MCAMVFKTYFQFAASFSRNFYARNVLAKCLACLLNFNAFVSQQNTSEKKFVL